MKKIKRSTSTINPVTAENTNNFHYIQGAITCATRNWHLKLSAKKEMVYKGGLKYVHDAGIALPKGTSRAEAAVEKSSSLP